MNELKSRQITSLLSYRQRLISIFEFPRSLLLFLKCTNRIATSLNGMSGVETHIKERERENATVCLINLRGWSVLSHRWNHLHFSGFVVVFSQFAALVRQFNVVETTKSYANSRKTFRKSFNDEGFPCVRNGLVWVGGNQMHFVLQ